MSEKICPNREKLDDELQPCPICIREHYGYGGSVPHPFPNTEDALRAELAAKILLLNELELALQFWKDHYTQERAELEQARKELAEWIKHHADHEEQLVQMVKAQADLSFDLSQARARIAELEQDIVELNKLMGTV